MTRISRALAAMIVVGAVALTGCATRPSPPANTSGDARFPVTVTPTGGKPVTLTTRPERIVSLSPTSTEDLFAIGAGAQVTAVDKQSNYPGSAPRSDLDAYKPNLEAITAKKPDLVISYYDANNLVSGLEKLKVPVVLLPAAASLDEAYGQITLLGKATGHTDAADKLVATMKAGIADAVARMPKPAKPLRYYYEVSPDGYTVTSRTFVGGLYGLFGLTNIADSAKGSGDYPQLSAEEVVKANPDLIFLADVKCCQQNLASVATRPGWRTLTAVHSGVVTLDDDVASRWGPRVVDLARAVSDAVAGAARRSG